jgi:hypothetical protein
MKNKLIVYGVEMSEIQNMMFSKYCSNHSISMNTKNENERKEFTKNWLINFCNENDFATK